MLIPDAHVQRRLNIKVTYSYSYKLQMKIKELKSK